MKGVNEPKSLIVRQNSVPGVADLAQNSGGEMDKKLVDTYDAKKMPENEYQKVPKPWKSVSASPKAALKVLDNIGQAIGHTPLVRLNRIAKLHGIQAEILVKCEFMNPAGSVKDRVARKMVESAEACGALRPGMTIIEPTSGNTGIALAMMAAIRGYRCIIVMPEKMSQEKELVIRSLGAQVVRVPHRASEHLTADKNPESDLFVAQRLQRATPNSIVLDQYRNEWNPFAHFESTAEEILDACEDKLPDAIVVGCGTGGTMTGIARKVRERCPQCKIIGVDPDGSTISSGGGHELAHSYEVEGIGYDFIPSTLHANLVDEWFKSTDANSFAMARALIREEGLLCGGSSGANVCAALDVAKKLGPGKRVVTLLPDGIRNYMSKFVSDEWMEAKGFSAK